MLLLFFSYFFPILTQKYLASFQVWSIDLNVNNTPASRSFNLAFCNSLTAGPPGILPSWYD